MIQLLPSLIGCFVLSVLLLLFLPYPPGEKRKIVHGYLSFLVLYSGILVLMFTGQFRYASVLLSVVAIYEVIQAAMKQQKLGDKIFLLSFPPLIFMIYCFLWYADKPLPAFQFYTCATAFSFNLFSGLINQVPQTHRLVPRLAGFSFEGLLTGLFLSGIVAWTGRVATANFSLICWAGIGLFSVLGSFYVAYCKRLLGISVFGRLVPGNGGIFDVMGGFFGATIAIYLLAYFFPI